MNNVNELLNNETFGEFRFFKQQLRDTEFACPHIDKENVCPACPKVTAAFYLGRDKIIVWFRLHTAQKDGGRSVGKIFYFGQKF